MFTKGKEMEQCINTTPFKEAIMRLLCQVKQGTIFYQCSIQVSNATQRATGTEHVLKKAVFDLFPDAYTIVCKNRYGQPYLYLPSFDDTQLYATATNDCGVYMGMVTALRQESQAQLIGTGIDLLFYSTAAEMILRSEPEELQMMFRKVELDRAFQKDGVDRQVRYLLKCVCLKEAAFKVISEAMERRGIASVKRELAYSASFMDIEVSDADAAPASLKLTGALEKVADLLGVTSIQASGIEQKDYVGAVALANEKKKVRSEL
jgi:phosphopantetheinyl transferase (holo-ACP synthase)